MSKLCLTLTCRTLEECLGLLETRTPDLAELRVDFLDPAEVDAVIRFPNCTAVPLILTCRKKTDGGTWTGTDARREAYLLKCLDGNFAYIDLEEDETSDALVQKAAAKRCRIIRSFHDFEGVPADLEERLYKMADQGHLVKAAVMPRGIKDLTKLFRLGQNWKGKDLILLGMGDYGVPSRILASRMNSFLTFCSADQAKAAAPGHMSLETLRDLYRFRQIDGKTPLYGIIGNPVLHTRSPEIHNNGLIAAGQKGVYVPFTVDDTAAFFELAELLNIKGFSVTVPHKQAVMDSLDRKSDAVIKVGACNTVVREGDLWCGYNTDVHGFITPLKDALGSLTGMKAAVIGAGGASRSAVYALIREKCETTVFNRTPSRAAALATEMGCLSGSLDDFLNTPAGTYDLIIQTTSSGMEGSSGGDNPVPGYRFAGTEVLYDIIYTPPVTPIMEKAGDAGCRVLGGWPMLVEQAKEQFRLFTGEILPQ